MAEILKTHGEFIAILDLLPPLCRKSIFDKMRERGIDSSFVSEIRLRSGRKSAVCSGRMNIACDYIMSADDIKYTVRALCSGSVYAYQNTIKQGYIPMSNGGRAGVVGDVADASLDIAVETISALNIRIPHHVRGICSRVYDLFKKTNKGIVIYSPPAVGKTTLLRDLAIELSRGEDAYKVALVDSRRELDNRHIPSDCMIDTYSGYPKNTGIEIAARTMSSEVIICDEIGYAEVQAIKYTVLCSVPVIAAAHASSIEELKMRKGIDELIDIGAFEYAVGLSRSGNSLDFSFKIDKLR